MCLLLEHRVGFLFPPCGPTTAAQRKVVITESGSSDQHLPACAFEMWRWLLSPQTLI